MTLTILSRRTMIYVLGTGHTESVGDGVCVQCHGDAKSWRRSLIRPCLYNIIRPINASENYGFPPPAPSHVFTVDMILPRDYQCEGEEESNCGSRILSIMRETSVVDILRN